VAGASAVEAGVACSVPFIGSEVGRRQSRD
jgi:hypothetical protein